jgi:hypothetical protein
MRIRPLQVAVAVAAAALAFGACDDGKRFPQFATVPDQVQHTEPITPRPTSPALHVDAISPAAATAGSAELIITLSGRGFVNEQHLGTLVRWSVNGRSQSLESTRVSDTQLVAKVGANLLGVPAAAKVSVAIWDVQGDAPQEVSNFVPFTVN